MTVTSPLYWAVSVETGEMKKIRSETRIDRWRQDICWEMNNRVVKEIDKVLLTLKPDLSSRQVLELLIPKHVLSQIDMLRNYVNVPQGVGNTNLLLGDDRFTLQVDSLFLPTFCSAGPEADPEILASFKQYGKDVAYWSTVHHEIYYLTSHFVKGWGYKNTLEILPELSVFGKEPWFDAEARHKLPKFSMPVLPKEVRRLCQKARLDIATMSVLKAAPAKYQEGERQFWTLESQAKWKLPEEEFEIPEVIEEE